MNILWLCLLSVFVDGVTSFTAYDCSQPESVTTYDLIATPECNENHAGLVERTLWSEIIQLKETIHITAYSCYLVVTTTAQHCGMFSHAGIALHQRFRQVVPIEAQDCRKARLTKQISLDKQVFNITENVRTNFQVIASGSFNMEKLSCTGDKDGLVTVNNYEAFFGEKSVLLHRVSNTVSIPTIGGTIAARVHDESVRDAEFGTYVWNTPNVECPDSMVSLYRGQLSVKTNSSSNPNLIGAMVIVDVHKANESQVAALELQEQLQLCGISGYKTHVKDIIYIPHADKGMSVAHGRFEDTKGADLTKLETSLSFQVIRELDNTNEVISTIRREICENRQKITESRLDSIAAGSNPYTSMRLFGRGHYAISSGSVVYVSKCRPVDVRVRKENLQNCTMEIPVIFKNESYFVNPINNILQKYSTTIICSQIAPPRYLIAQKWFCGFPEILECTAPEKVPAEGVQIPDLSYGALHFGDSIYSKAMLDVFEQLTQAEFGRKAFLTDSAHQAIAGQKDGEWGSSLSSAALDSIVDEIGGYFIPFYRFLGKPAFFIMMLIFVAGIIKLVLSICIRAYIISKRRGCGAWILAGFCGTLFYLALAPARLANRIVDGAVSEAFGHGQGEDDESADDDEERMEMAEKEKKDGLYPNLEDSNV